MAYQPPHKRTNVLPQAFPKTPTKTPIKTLTKPEEFPVLAPAPQAKSTTMNFASLFKNAIKKKKEKKMKWGMVRLTKHGVVDSLTPEEREALEKEQNEAIQEERLWKTYVRLETDRNIRREFDRNYESPAELTVTTSEEETTEEEEVLTDEVEEDEFEPGI